MKLATTTGDFNGYVRGVDETVKCFSDTGFKLLDYSFYEDAKADSMLLSSNWKDYISSIDKAGKKYGFTFVQAHSPGGNALDEDNEAFILATKRSILACGMLGIPNIVVHAGVLGNVSKEEFFEKNKEFYLMLSDEMEKAQVNVLVENSARANMGDNYYFFDGKTMYDFLKWVNHPLLHGCWDTGHGNLEGEQYSEILALKDELRAVHIQDNFGFSDDHIMPFSGTTNMDDVMKGLIDVGYTGYFTFEASNGLRRMGSWPIYRRKINGGNDRLSNPSTALQIKATALLYEIGKYILSAYDCYEY